MTDKINNKHIGLNKCNKLNTNQICDICFINVVLIKTDCSHVYCSPCYTRINIKFNYCSFCRRQFSQNVTFI